jgi:hypothetical protein
MNMNARNVGRPDDVARIDIMPPKLRNIERSFYGSLAQVELKAQMQGFPR